MSCRVWMADAGKGIRRVRTSGAEGDAVLEGMTVE